MKRGEIYILSSSPLTPAPEIERVRVCVCVVRRQGAHATKAGHTRVVRAHTYSRRRECAQASERAVVAPRRHTRVEREVREEGNAAAAAGSVRRLGWLAKGRFLDPDRERDAATGGRGRERERPEEGTGEDSFVRSFIRVVSAAQRDRKVEEEGIDCLFFSLSPPLDLYSPSLDGLRRRKKVKDRFSGRRGS